MQKKPAVANLCFTDAWGGLEMSTVKITRLFAEAGYDSSCICQPDTPIAKAVGKLGIPSLETGVLHKYVSPSTTLSIRRWVRERNVQAIFLHSMRDIWLVTPALAGMPEVKLFGFARMFFKDIKKKDFLHSLMYSRLEKMISLTEIHKKFLADCLPVPPEKIIAIPNGVDVERFKPRARRNDIRAQLGVDSSHFLFGLIGRLDRQKGSLEFVEAAAEVVKTYPQARFVLVGGNTANEGEFDKFVHARVQELNLQSQVLLTDFRSDIPDLMNALDVFVMPSYEETFGNVVLEAMSSGVPCIASNSGGAPEILDRGQTGLLAEPRSSTSLAASMSRFFSEPRLAQQLGLRGREKVLAEYDMRVVFKRIEGLLY